MEIQQEQFEQLVQQKSGLLLVHASGGREVNSNLKKLALKMISKMVYH